MSLLVYTPPKEGEGTPQFIDHSITYIIENLRLALKDGIQIEESDFLNLMKELLAWEELVDYIADKSPKTGFESSKTGKFEDYNFHVMLRIYCIQKWFGLSIQEILQKMKDNHHYIKFAIDEREGRIPTQQSIARFFEFIEKIKTDIVNNNIYCSTNKTGSSFANILHFLCLFKNQLQNNDWLHVLLYFYLRFYLFRRPQNFPDELKNIHMRIRENILNIFFQPLPEKNQDILCTLIALFAVFLNRRPKDESSYFVEYIGIHRDGNPVNYHDPIEYEYLLYYFSNRRRSKINEGYFRETYRLLNKIKHHIKIPNTRNLTTEEINQIEFEYLQELIENDIRTLLPKIDRYQRKSNKEMQGDEKMYGSIYAYVNDLKP